MDERVLFSRVKPREVIAPVGGKLNESSSNNLPARAPSSMAVDCFGI